MAACRASLLKVVFDRDRSNVLTSRCDDQFLYTSGDLKINALVDPSLISSFEVPVFIDTLPGGLLIFQIPHHDMSTFDSNLTLTLLVLISNLDMGSGNLLTSVIQTEFVEVAKSGCSCSLTQTIHVE